MRAEPTSQATPRAAAASRRPPRPCGSAGRRPQALRPLLLEVVGDRADPRPGPDLGGDLHDDGHRPVTGCVGAGGASAAAGLSLRACPLGVTLDAEAETEHDEGQRALHGGPVEVELPLHEARDEHGDRERAVGGVEPPGDAQ